MRFVLFSYEIIIRKNFKLHYTEQESSFKDEKEYRLQFPMEKRIHAMVSNDGYITYIFRDFDIALMTYREYAVQLLQNVMQGLTENREKLLFRGATSTEIKMFDDKVHSSFKLLCKILEQRHDLEVLKDIKDFDIKNYHNEFHKNIS